MALFQQILIRNKDKKKIEIIIFPQFSMADFLKIIISRGIIIRIDTWNIRKYGINNCFIKKELVFLNKKIIFHMKYYFFILRLKVAYYIAILFHSMLNICFCASANSCDSIMKPNFPSLLEIIATLLSYMQM